MLVSLHKESGFSHKDLAMICHRGGREFGLENTLDSLASALDFGVEMVETDVRKSRDGVPIIHHSPFLGLRPISHLTLSEIREKAPEIPTLEEYLDLASNSCSLDLDIKRCQPSILAELIERTSPAYPILISSFDADFLKEFGEMGVEAELGLLAQYDPMIDRLIGEATACGAGVLLPISFSVREDLVGAAQQASLSVITWTVNITSQLENMIIAGVDGVITDSYRELSVFLKSEIQEQEMPSLPAMGESSVQF